MSTMRAKYYVTKIEDTMNGAFKVGEHLIMAAVCAKSYDPDGFNSEEGLTEDQAFTKWSPSGNFDIWMTNPNLYGRFKVGAKYYLDFTEARE